MNRVLILIIATVFSLNACDSQSVTTKEKKPETTSQTNSAKPEGSDKAPESTPTEVSKPTPESAPAEEPKQAPEPDREPGVPPSDVAAVPADASKTDTGIAYKVLKQGEGETTPRTDSTVTVHYQGWTTDGKLFDSSLKHGRPFEQRVGNLIKGWQLSLTAMKKGEKRRIWVPAKLGYENSSNPDAPKGMLVFEVELISFK